jgi:LAO/AO transport system kinase
MELADLLLVTKADGDLLPAARRAAANYQMALHLMRPKHIGLQPKVLSVSSIEGSGIATAWSEIAAIHSALRADGRLVRLRAEQAKRWFWSEVQTLIDEKILTDRRLADEAQTLETAVKEGTATPYGAARNLLRAILPAGE